MKEIDRLNKSKQNRADLLMSDVKRSENPREPERGRGELDRGCTIGDSRNPLRHPSDLSLQ